ncbi:MAG: HipA N-terminal domain-containing protein [Bacteroidales bacterium]|nr:HipA N-terminal domain-containing protein [Bacteroidales bacterium]
MRIARISINRQEAGILKELVFSKRYVFEYTKGYTGPPVSLTMPLDHGVFEFDSFPSFFDGLLPEGHQLDGLLKFGKIDRNDFFAQLIAVGDDLVGNVSVKEMGT